MRPELERETQREEERRVEKEETRIREERRETERRREKEELLIALREAQPVVHQTVHISGTKLPKMTEGEDVITFIEMFEADMVAIETLMTNGKLRCMQLLTAKLS